MKLKLLISLWFLKPQPNDSNISTQHIPTLQARHLQASTKSQHLNATDRNIVGCNMLHAFGHPVATCCDMLRVENRTSAQAQEQHCCTNLAKRLQLHATSTNVAWKIWPVSNWGQQHQTCHNTSQKGGQAHATCCIQQCCDMLRWNVAIVLYSTTNEAPRPELSYNTEINWVPALTRKHASLYSVHRYKYKYRWQIWPKGLTKGRNGGIC